MTNRISRDLRIMYTNWRGERRPRTIRPISIFFGSNRWHPDIQWLVVAWDVEKRESRTFALEQMEFIG